MQQLNNKLFFLPRTWFIAIYFILIDFIKIETWLEKREIKLYFILMNAFLNHNESQSFDRHNFKLFMTKNHMILIINSGFIFGRIWWY